MSIVLTFVLSGLAAGTVISRAAAVNDPLYARPAVDARFALALINSPEPFGRSEVTAVPIRHIDLQRGAGVDCFAQHLANGLIGFARARL